MLRTLPQNESRMSQFNPESNNTNSPDRDDSIEAAIESHTQSIDRILSDSDADRKAIEAVQEQISELFEQLYSHLDEWVDKKVDHDQLERDLQQLRNKHVPTVAVKHVLLEYGIDPNAVDSIIDDIEAVDDSMRADSNE
mgnify:CR=1 FL=1